MISDDHLYRIVLFSRSLVSYRVVHIYIYYFVFLPFVLLYLIVLSLFPVSIVQAYTEGSLFCTGYTRPFVGSYFSICVTGFVFVPGLLLAS